MSEDRKKWLKRPPRVKPTEHEFFFSFSEPHTKSPCVVDNVSKGGIGMNLSEELADLEVGSHVKGLLRFGEYSFLCEAKVVRRSGLYAGFQFTEKVEGLEGALVVLFHVEMSAHRLTEVNTKVLKQLSAGFPRWYRELDGAELYLILNEDHDEAEIVKFVITLEEHLIKLESGNIMYEKLEEELSTPLSYTASTLTEEMEKPTINLITKAIRFSKNLDVLPVAHRDTIRKILESELNKIKNHST